MVDDKSVNIQKNEDSTKDKSESKGFGKKDIYSLHNLPLQKENIKERYEKVTNEDSFKSIRRKDVNRIIKVLSKDEKHIFYGPIVGLKAVENENGKEVMFFVIANGTMPVFIPASEVSIKEDDERGLKSYNKWNHYSQYIGHTVPYQIEWVDRKFMEAYGVSREARSIYFEKRYEKLEKRLKEGEVIPLNIVKVNVGNLYVDLFGKYVDIKTSFLVKSIVPDLRKYFKQGETLKTKIISIDIDDTNEPLIDRFKISLKSKDFMETNVGNYKSILKEGNYLIGFVTNDTGNAIYSKINFGIDILCSLDKNLDRPSPGEKVLIKITSINEEKDAIYGVIVDNLP